MGSSYGSRTIRPAKLNGRALSSAINMERRLVKAGNGREIEIELEHSFWDALEDIARRQDMTLGELIVKVSYGYNWRYIADVIRYYAVSYYRDLSGNYEDRHEERVH